MVAHAVLPYRRLPLTAACTGPQQRAQGIYATTYAVLELAASDGVPPAIAADRLAERRMRDVGRLRGIWLD